MITSLNSLAILWLTATIIAAIPLRADTLCSERVASLVSGDNPALDVQQSQRLEVRRCKYDNGLALLQLVGWKEKSDRPTLVIDTHDLFVEQLVMSRGVCVVETGGGTANRLFVVTFVKGVPELKLKLSTKKSIRIEATYGRVTVALSDQTGTETYRFSSSQ